MLQSHTYTMCCGSLNAALLCSHLAEQRSKASAELARASHARQSQAGASDGSGTQHRQPSPIAQRRMASAAVQGLQGTFFQHGSFLELVSLCRSRPRSQQQSQNPRL